MLGRPGSFTSSAGQLSAPSAASKREASTWSERGLQKKSRLQRLFGLVTLAWMFCLQLGGLARPDPSHSRPETWSQSGQPGASRCSASRGCPALETRTMQGFPGTAHPSFLPARRGWRRSCHLLRAEFTLSRFLPSCLPQRRMPHHCPCQLDPFRRRQTAHHHRDGLVTQPQRLRGQVGADFDHAADSGEGRVCERQRQSLALKSTSHGKSIAQLLRRSSPADSDKPL